MSTIRLHSSRKRARPEDFSYPDTKKRRVDGALTVNHQTEKIHKKVTVTIGCERFKFFYTYLGHLVKGVMPNKRINTNIREEVTVGEFTVKLRVGGHTKEATGTTSTANNLGGNGGGGVVRGAIGPGGAGAGGRATGNGAGSATPATLNTRATGGSSAGVTHEHWVCVWVEVISDEPMAHSGVQDLLRGEPMNDLSPFWQYDLTVSNALSSTASNPRLHSSTPKSQVLKRFTSKHQIVNNGEWGWSTAIGLQSLARYTGNVSFEFDITIFKPRQSCIDNAPTRRNNVSSAEPMRSILSRMFDSKIGSDMKILCRKRTQPPLHTAFFGDVSTSGDGSEKSTPEPDRRSSPLEACRSTNGGLLESSSSASAASGGRPEGSGGAATTTTTTTTTSERKQGDDDNDVGFDHNLDDYEEILCHKGVLCGASEVFSAMLQSSFVESMENQIAIDDFDPTITRTMIEYLYLGERALPSNEMSLDWCQLFGICEKYGIENLAQKSVEKMVAIARSLASPDIQFGCVTKEGDDRFMDVDDSGEFDQPIFSGFGLDEDERVDSDCEGPRGSREELISKCNVLFSLLAIVSTFCHATWLSEMESCILSVIQPHLQTLLHLNDVRFSKLPHDALIKLLRCRG